MKFRVLDVVECDRSARSNELAINLEVHLHAVIGVIAVDEEEVQFRIAESRFHLLEYFRAVRVSGDDVNARSEALEPFRAIGKRLRIVESPAARCPARQID